MGNPGQFDACNSASQKIMEGSKIGEIYSHCLRIRVWGSTMAKGRYARLHSRELSTLTLLLSMLFVLSVFLLMLLALGLFSLPISTDDSPPNDLSSFRRRSFERREGIWERGEQWTEILAWEPQGIYIPQFFDDGEGLQILHYEVGQKYEPHFDYFLDEFNTKNGGQRIATVLMYLSDVDEGAETLFPVANKNFSSVPWWDELSECAKEGLSVKSKRGDALLFWSMRPDASLDPSSLHGSCPVIRGNKWSATKWMHVEEYKV